MGWGGHEWLYLKTPLISITAVSFTKTAEAIYACTFSYISVKKRKKERIINQRTP